MNKIKENTNKCVLMNFFNEKIEKIKEIIINIEKDLKVNNQKLEYFSKMVKEKMFFKNQCLFQNQENKSILIRTKKKAKKNKNKT